MDQGADAPEAGMPLLIASLAMGLADMAPEAAIDEPIAEEAVSAGAAAPAEVVLLGELVVPAPAPLVSAVFLLQAANEAATRSAAARPASRCDCDGVFDLII